VTRTLKPTVLWATTVLAVVILATGCVPLSPRSAAGSQPEKTLSVFAAASLQEVFRAIGDQFSLRNPGVTVEFNFAGSQQLAQQLAAGAPGDLFASANKKQMDVAIEGGRVAKDAPSVFAGNRLVVVIPKPNRAGVTQLADLARPGLKIVLADKTVPAGDYAIRFLQNVAADPQYGPEFEQAVQANVVSYEENVRSVLNKIILGEADAGIVYQTDATPLTVDQVAVIDIPDDLNVSAYYSIAPVVDSPGGTLAQDFVSYLLSPDGQKTLQEFGFLAAQP
jgi:molybdate transport system substrate-binding protein